MDLSCPNCGIVIEVRSSNNNKTTCPKCLESTGKRFIMLERNERGIVNMGDGLFQQEDRE